MSRNARLPVAFLQTAYWPTDAALESARRFVAEKCRNQASLLTAYLPYRLRAEPMAGRKLQSAIRTIRAHAAKVPTSVDRRALMLLEARASAAYWHAFGAICRQPSAWKRVRPHARDPLNRTLNVGYSLLEGRVSKLVAETGLDPSIGFLHAPRAGKHALAYDLQELFRQPAVDAAIAPIFSRRKRHEAIDDGMIVHAVLERMNGMDAFGSRFETAVHKQCEEMIRSLRQVSPITPYHHRWSHKK